MLRAKTLFRARIGVLALVLMVISIPSWAAIAGISGQVAFFWFAVVVAYSGVNYILFDRGLLGRVVTFLALTLDLAGLAALITLSGGLHSPLLPAQLIFTLFFAMLFPRPWGIIPPLMLLPVAGYLDGVFYAPGLLLQNIFILVFYPALNLIIVYAVVHLTSREEHQHAEIASLTKDLREMAVKDERRRIAREMHDGLGALLSSQMMQADYLSSLNDPDEIRKETGELRITAEECLGELRRCVLIMRDDFDLKRGLEEFCTSLRSRSKIDVELSTPAFLPALRPDRQLALLRILQEAASNAVRHGCSNRITVNVSENGTGLSLIVTDNGTGFDPEEVGPGPHYGLVNMRERARWAGGNCEIKSVPGAGTTVSVTFFADDEACPGGGTQ